MSNVAYRRPWCDQPDFAAIAEAIGRGETTLHDVWTDYAATASRPYTKKSFQNRVRETRQAPDAPQAPPHAPFFNSVALDYELSQNYWAAHVSPKPSRVLTLTNDAASLRVKGGALHILDEGRLIRYEPGAVTPDAIVLAGWNGALTMLAVRFCAEHKIALVFLDWLNGLMSFVAPEPKAAAALVRAQVNANPVPIAREIVALKIEHCRMVGCLTPGEARSLVAAVRRARSTPEIMNCEATAAKRNFDRRQCELTPRGGPLPVAWRRFTQRSASPNSYSPRRAKHPINAMLNVNYSIVAGRLAAQLSARGACLSIGFLHADKKNRFSLVYDAIEPLRPLIEAKTFAFVAKRKFSRADFFRLSDGEVRIAPNLLKVLTQETALPESDIQGTSDFVVSLIQRRRAR